MEELSSGFGFQTFLKLIQWEDLRDQFGAEDERELSEIREDV